MIYDEKKILNKALIFAGIIQLPEPIDPNQIWVRGIAKILKQNGRIEYGIVEHTIENFKDSYRVIKSFGTTSIISKVLEIYPYQYVRYVPDIKAKDEIIEYIAKHSDKDIESIKLLKPIQLKKTLIEVLIKKDIDMFKKI